ncbi:Defective in cullin neddylation protein 1 [Talaromyces pinophilus]|nr:Defective in cullin neddylation protein 1 [Talaromyces pinophilus]
MRALTEEETKTLFQKLANYTGRSLNQLIQPTEDNERYVFRIQGSRVYYVKQSIANLATSVARDNLLSLGVCVGKFTKTMKFRLHITALDLIAPYARYKVTIKQNGEMPFLYGGNVVKAHVLRWSEDCPEHSGCVVFSQDDTPLGFGVTARSTAEARKLEPTAVVLFRQGDVGEYLRERLIERALFLPPDQIDAHSHDLSLGFIPRATPRASSSRGPNSHPPRREAKANMPPYTGTQRHYISQFVGFTQAKDAVAAKYLRANGWNVEQAVDAYFSSSQATAASTSTPALNKIFDEFRDDPKENPDTIGIEGAMKFLEAIQVRLDEVACLGIAELLKSPSMGEFTRTGFVDGWKSVGVESIPQMISHAASLRTRISSQPDTFRKVYRYAFPLCRMQGQRNLTFEIAAEQWQLFFTSENGGVDWQTPSTPWLDWYLDYLKSKGQRPVNKDLWEQTEVFMRKTLEDENFGWWDADGAWPGTLDEFVEFVKQDKRGGKPAEAMNTE